MTSGELDRVLNDPIAEQHLRAYYGTAAAGERYTGRLFDLLGAGSNGSAESYRITSDDLIAVQMLSVVVDCDIAFALLTGDLGDDLEHLLHAIDPNVSIDAPGARALLNGPATDAWKLLERQAGVGWVTAGKILARKRPLLVPVYDTVVRCVVRPVRNQAWHWFADMFTSNNGALVRQLEGLRTSAQVDERVSPLRILDVVIWMRHKDSHTPSRCRRLTL